MTNRVGKGKGCRMRAGTLEKLNVIVSAGKGYVDTSALLEVGYTNRNILELLELGVLEKIAHGKYWIVHSEFTKPKDYKPVEIGIVNPDSIICADSACYYQGLISVEPKTLSIATRRNDRHKMEMSFPVKRHYYAERSYEKNCLVKSTPQGEYKIYDLERSVCDCIRFQEDIENEVFELVIENYKKNKELQSNRLMAYARAMRMGKKAEEILQL